MQRVTFSPTLMPAGWCWPGVGVFLKKKASKTGIDLPTRRKRVPQTHDLLPRRSLFYLPVQAIARRATVHGNQRNPHEARVLGTPPDITHFVPRKIIQCSDCERKWHPVDDRKKLKLEVVEWYIPYSVLDNELNENASLLTRLRIEKGLSMEALAKEMGVTKPTIISYEKGRVRQPQQVVIEAYAKRFGLSREAVIKAILWRKRE